MQLGAEKKLPLALSIPAILLKDQMFWLINDATMVFPFGLWDINVFNCILGTETAFKGFPLHQWTAKISKPCVLD